ncbi:PorP/SprF family type IX secretion system membrane protein [Longitalea luteola]|uniref:PorP/SprF family type IX secretion system membrane protein n=1 Tax=Longitalea luteola TaxID=2812563 RepID=UPI001A961FCE|nr:PorP/SprF family type IX secretion system membrane protein [Longitalea luteola]
MKTFTETKTVRPPVTRDILNRFLQTAMLPFLCIVCFWFPATAQDLHFSQWFNSPLTTNPANTGFIPDADYRVGINYRNQWSTIMSVPYKTMSIWGDAQVFRDRIESGWLGLGGVILRDVAGSGSLTSTKIYASAAYHQMLGVAHLLSAGFNVGWANKRINTTDLKFPDQFDGKFFDSNLPTSVVLDQPNVNYFDMQVGVNYAYFPTDRLYINGGISVWHINQPRESFFYNDAADFDSRIPRRYNAFANASIKLNDQVIVNPMAYFSSTAKASELVAGGNVQYNLSGDGETQLLGGLYYRPGDAVIPMIGFEWKTIKLMFTYDATTSSLKQYNHSRGAFEFALLRHGFYNEYNGDRRQSMCPSFKY